MVNLDFVCCDTKIIRTKDESWATRVDRYYIFGLRVYTHYWREEKK